MTTTARRAPARARHCETVYDHCQAPPGIEDDDGTVTTAATCFACGAATCLSCSARTRWHDFGRRRVCFDCLTQHGRGREVADLLWRQAGYDGPAPDHVVAGHLLG